MKCGRDILHLRTMYTGSSDSLMFPLAPSYGQEPTLSYIFCLFWYVQMLR